MRLTQIFFILEYFRHYSEITVGDSTYLKVVCNLREEEAAQSVWLFCVLANQHQHGPSSTLLELVGKSGNAELSDRLSLTLF